MNLNQLTITEANEGLKTKKFSSVELTKACLERIKKIEPSNASYNFRTRLATKDSITHELPKVAKQ